MSDAGNSHNSLLLSIQNIYALFIFTIGTQLLSLAINTASMVLADVSAAKRKLHGHFFQICKSLLQVVFRNVQLLKESPIIKKEEKKRKTGRILQ